MTHFHRFSLILITCFFSIGKITIQAQDAAVGELISCYGDETDVAETLPSDWTNAQLRLPKASTINVTYDGFPEAAKTAFQRAVDIWESYLVSSQVITINAVWKELATSTLAQTGSTKIFKNFPAAPKSEIWYPVALAEAISGKNLNDKEAEINVNVNSAIKWSYDGKPISGAFDFSTVVLHEIAHGLGFNSSFGVSSDQTEGKWGQSSLPYIYDFYVNNGNNQQLIDTRTFGNPSQALLLEVSGNNLFFVVSPTINAYDMIRLNAPVTFRSGGSISHLDEQTYPPGNANTLMTPSIQTREVITNPGDFTLQILNQLGWGIRNLPTNSNSVLGKETTNAAFVLYPNPATDELRLSIGTTLVTGDGELIIYNAAGQPMTAMPLDKNRATIPLANYPAGKYFVSFISEGKIVYTKAFVKVD